MIDSKNSWKTMAFIGNLTDGKNKIAELDIRQSNVQHIINLWGYLFHWTEILCVSTPQKPTSS